MPIIVRGIASAVSTGLVVSWKPVEINGDCLSDRWETDSVQLTSRTSVAFLCELCVLKRFKAVLNVFGKSTKRRGRGGRRGLRLLRGKSSVFTCRGVYDSAMNADNRKCGKDTHLPYIFPVGVGLRPANKIERVCFRWHWMFSPSRQFPGRRPGPTGVRERPCRRLNSCVLICASANEE